MKMLHKTLAILAAGIASLANAATQTVTVNADGSFTPATLTINSGDIVEWRVAGFKDSIIPITWDGVSASFCSSPKAYATSDINNFAGPMPVAPSGLFSLSPLDLSLGVESTRAACVGGPVPLATAGAEMLCRNTSAAPQASLDSTWQDADITGVFIRLLWKDIHIAPGTADSSYNFTVLDREVNKAVKNGKLFSLAIKAGDDGTPAWLFSNGVTRLALQDSGSDGTTTGCGSRMDLGNPTQATYQQHYFDLLRKIAARLKSRADWYRALGYIKPSGANLFSHENRLPKRCETGCVCNTQVFAANGYTPNGLYAFYQAQNALLASEFPGKTISYALIQDGFPLINNNGDYEKSDGTSSGGVLPGALVQTLTILDQGQAAHGLRWAVQHNGLSPKQVDTCQTQPNGAGCPNRYVLQEGEEGQVTGWQTNNSEKVANAVDTDSTLQNALVNSRGVFVELYEERFWEAQKQAGRVIDPRGSNRTIAQWTTEFHNRRRTLFPTLIDPVPSVHRHTFTRTLTAATGNQTFYYVHGAKCGVGNARPGSIVVQPSAAPQTGWWWNPAEDGRGFGIEVSGSTMFMSAYLYDTDGHATWMVAQGPVGQSGATFSAMLYQVANGQTLTGPYKPAAPITIVGPITLTFANSRAGTLVWPGGTIQIQRFDDVIGSGNGITPAFVPENGWWWNVAESGRGYFMEFKNNFAFIAGYMYEPDGRPVWYGALNSMSTPQSFSSNFYQVANGQTLTGPYKKPTISNPNVGAVAVQFIDAANAVMTLPGGRQITITRQRF